ncbi:MAG TPA: FAD-dependent oxidoreductase, partial [Anaeromyxobacteraceae bacterium]|nr:FAD-dependent oxidoreductase [Anaeromyxobacteraceae bacterium]
MTGIPQRYRVANLALHPGDPEEVLLRSAAEKLGVRPADLSSVVVVKRSLDARKKGHPRWLVSLEASLDSPLTSLPPDVTAAPAPAPPPPLARPP